MIRYIHENPVKGGLSRDLRYEYSSCPSYENGRQGGLTDTEKPLEKIGREAFFAYHARPCADECMDVTESERRPITEDAAAALVRKYGRAEDLDAFLALPREKQEKAIVKAHEQGASVRQLARVTGVSKGIVEKWLRRNG